jgi:hypothetical protein
MTIKAAVNKLVIETSADQHDVRVLLKTDHDEALAIAKEMCETGDAQRRHSLLGKLKPALVAHSRAEETKVYDLLIKVKDCQEAHDIGNEGYVEHSLLDKLLVALEHTQASDSDKWRAQAKVLHELLSHHIEEEHGTMFSELAKHFDSAARIKMGEAFLSEKQTILHAEDAHA